MARTLKVKVPVAALIKSAEKERERIIKEFEKSLTQVDKSRERWQKAALTALDRAYEDIQAGNFPKISSVWGYSKSKNLSDFEIQVKAPKPVEPAEAPNTNQVDRDLALLKACSDTELAIGTDDNFARYL